MSHADTVTEHDVVHAIIDHHARLATGLDQRVQALLHLVDTGQLIKAEAARRDLLGYLQREILPHARAEEQALYPPAASLPEGRLLVSGMIDEHHALADLVAELAASDSPVPAAAAAHALAALFDAHLHKENDLVLPLLAADPEVELATVLAGMHELIGTDSAEHGPDDAGAAAGGCGCGGCACGGDVHAGNADRAAPVLSVDGRLDVRAVPHSERHALVLSTVADLRLGQAVVLVASHAPRPVLAEIHNRFGAQVEAQWLQAGPDVWQIRLERISAVG